MSLVGPFKDLDYTYCYYYNYLLYGDKNPKYCSDSKRISYGLIPAIFPNIMIMMQFAKAGYIKSSNVIVFLFRIILVN
jgi:hypothetical protein